jgi:hypothetical protein
MGDGGLEKAPSAKNQAPEKRRKAPNPNLQTPENVQAPRTKLQWKMKIEDGRWKIGGKPRRVAMRA